MKIQRYNQEDRGHANHGWLNAKHTFSFASWYNPEKVHFGALRVLNDDIVAPKMGFGKHPHDNMEIITIPLSGSLKHEDSMGNGSTITAGEVQVMSAGTGVFHSEFNASETDFLNLFQIWIFPNKQSVQPRYDQISYNLSEHKNEFVQVVSPNKDDSGTWIHQDAWIHLAEIEMGNTLEYKMKGSESGAFVMVIEGEITIANEQLHEKDAVGISESSTFAVTTSTNSKVIVIEVPMNI